MATSTIRNLDAPVEEARAILTGTVAPPPRETINLAEAIRYRFAPLGGVELEPHPLVTITRPWQFEE